MPLFILLVFAALSIHNARSWTSSEINLNKFLKINPITDYEKAFSPPTSLGAQCIQDIAQQSPGKVKIDFTKLQSLDGFSIFFPGSLQTESYYPRDFNVVVVDSSGQSRTITKVLNYKESYYKIIFPQTVSTNSLQVDIIRAPVIKNNKFQQVCFQDIKFFRSYGMRSILTNLQVSISSQGIANYWLYYIIFLAVLYIPGLALQIFFAKRRNVKIDLQFAYIFSPAWAVFGLATLTALYFLTGLKYLFLIEPVSLVAAVYYLTRCDIHGILRKLVSLFSITLVSIFVIFLVVARRDSLENMPSVGEYLDHQTPVPVDGYIGYHADSRMPWGIARVYYHRFRLDSSEARDFLMGTTIFDRTPILPMITTSIIGVFGEGHFVYQRFLETLASLFFVSFYYLFRRSTSKVVSQTIFLMMLISVQVTLLAINVELYYKYFSVYPVLLAVLLLYEPPRHKTALIGGLLSLAFLIHPSTLIYTGAILVFVAYRDRKNIEQMAREVVLVSLPLLILVGIWYTAPKFLKLDPLGGRHQSRYFGELTKINGDIILNKAQILISIIIPNIYLRGENVPKISALSAEYQYQFLRYSLISNLSPLLFCGLLYYMVKKNSKNKNFLYLGAIPLVIFWIFFLHQYERWYNYGSSFFLLFPFTTPFLLGFIIQNIKNLSYKIRTLLVGSYIMFMGITFMSIGGILSPIVNQTHTTMILGWCLVGVFIFISVIILMTCFTVENCDSP